MPEPIEIEEWEVKLTRIDGTVVSTITPPVGLTMAVQIVDAIYRANGVALDRYLAIVPVRS